MQRSRFVFLALPMPDGNATTADRTPAEGILWMLVSPNNRPLGRGTTYHESYADCLGSVESLKANADRVLPVETTVERTGQWTWRIELDGASVAASSRSYLRTRECAYNLAKFLEALPTADIVAGTRSARRGRQRPEPSPGWRRGERLRGGLAG
ncbi:hypothetical protein SAMN05421812_103271 [Asanoa hainanensis]|uniref:DUF1508 domain-containing protein n=1 Tax=Asanoa hainanensis TaxID=560556 RepID=A0A239K441_9ACTN|nr:hypothetical protein [Asanoa hainanensis]SNT12439.1 hypothetical protein SAMN05421812_103271 [Asanoa hainanensis]